MNNRNFLIPSGCIAAVHAPDKSWSSIVNSGKRPPSAVLVSIMLAHQAASVADSNLLMIRRSSRTGSHRGQIGFPGGRRETEDKSPSETACREAYEEVGLEANQLAVIGQLDPLVSIDGSSVVPVVAVSWQSSNSLTANVAEVQSIILASTAQLARNRCEQFSFNMFGCWRKSFLYRTDQVSVWGLSAQIIRNLSLKV
jgi:8-oxo-dGTP pyrophosphatase MutT (NUDIX family)